MYVAIKFRTRKLKGDKVEVVGTDNEKNLYRVIGGERYVVSQTEADKIKIFSPAAFSRVDGEAFVDLYKGVDVMVVTVEMIKQFVKANHLRFTFFKR